MEWVAPVALAVVFAWAGGAKFADLQGTQEGFRALGLSQPEPRAIQVATFEIVTAVLLIVAPIGGALVALALLAVFTFTLVRLLRSGVTAPCRCFGGVRTRPIAWTDLARNAVLAALAVVTLVAPPG
jgi:uncharacterized membrane protein YphA (DoxX/SURF4 family)